MAEFLVCDNCGETNGRSYCVYDRSRVERMEEQSGNDARCASHGALFTGHPIRGASHDDVRARVDRGEV